MDVPSTALALPFTLAAFAEFAEASTFGLLLSSSSRLRFQKSDFVTEESAAVDSDLRRRAERN